jgi:hypothetical protein
MGQLVNHTSFQFNGTVVETLCGSPLFFVSLAIIKSSFFCFVAHHRTGGDGGLLLTRPGHLNKPVFPHAVLGHLGRSPPF